MTQLPERPGHEHLFGNRIRWAIRLLRGERPEGGEEKTHLFGNRLRETRKALKKR